MEKYTRVNWVNGTKTKNAYVTIDDEQYDVIDAEYESNTPISADNLNIMDSEIKNVSDEVYDLYNCSQLWSGENSMDGNQTITLSKNISDLKRGVLLIFCYYSGYGTTAYNNNRSFFIPKKYVELHGSRGTSFIMSDAYADVISTKYLYINNNTIIGNNQNVASGTVNGITYDNNRFMLAYVYGI